MKDIQSLKKKYMEQLQQKLNAAPDDFTPVKTNDYEQFRKELQPRGASFYEQLCGTVTKVVQFSPKQAARDKIQESITTAHLQVTPEGAYTVAYMIPLLLMFISLFAFFLIPLLFGLGISFFFFVVCMLVSVILIIPLQKYPHFLANSWRLKASNQMVLSIFYLVTYMRQSSNLERAFEFAAQHLDPPLSLDLKRILWSVETEQYGSLNDALDDYLKGWKKHNDEFVDAMHLLQSSLLEGSEGKRISLLDKALDVMLEGTFEKMMHYAQNLKNPITTLHMLGIILPVLGLVILPLAVSFIESISWVHLAVFYNILLPVVVYLMSKNILSTRPSGYGDSDVSDARKGLKKYKKVIWKPLGLFELRVNPLIIACVIGGILLLIGLLPVGMRFADDSCWDFSNPDFFCESDDRNECLKTYCAWDYRQDEEGTKGPFGFIASLLSVFIPLSAGLGGGLYYKLRSKNVIKIRTETKKLEKEFSNALFQLGNRLGDGLPAELAIPKVGLLMDGSVSGSFFQQVGMNMQKLGMGLVAAIFDPKKGALISFPSNIVESSMKVLVEGMKKGPLVAAQAVNNIARYIKEIHRVNERLKDLLADIISSMKQQISFLTPVISGVVVGITSMITFVLGQLKTQSADISSGLEGAGQVQQLLNLGDGIPTFYFQTIVGLYVVQIGFILTVMANAIENGEDKLGEQYLLGKNLVRTTLLYVVITFLVMVIFQVLAAEITKGIALG